MARALTTKQMLLLAVVGVVAAEIWVGLFGLWAIYDTPFLKLLFAAGLTGAEASRISMFVFALASATSFVLPLQVFFRHCFLAAAAVFILAFLATFVVPVLFEGEPLLWVAGLTDVWLFALVFGACAAFFRVVRHA